MRIFVAEIGILVRAGYAHVSRAHQARELRTVVLAAEHHIRRATELRDGERRPSFRVVLEFVRDEPDLHVGVDLAKPLRADFSGDQLRRVMRDHHHEPVDLSPGFVDQEFVSAVRRIELPDHETGFHAAPVFLACVFHSRRPRTAITRKAA